MKRRAEVSQGAGALLIPPVREVSSLVVFWVCPAGTAVGEGGDCQARNWPTFEASIKKLRNRSAVHVLLWKAFFKFMSATSSQS